MRLFHLVREVDVSGISGTGVVAEGVVFSDGKVALRWKSRLSSIGIFQSVEDLMNIHGHEGSTKLVWEGSI